MSAFILAAIDNSSTIKQRLMIEGPEPLSFRDATLIYERVLGHPIPVRSVPPGGPVPGALEIVAQLLAGLDTFDSPIEMTQTARTFDIRLTPLEEVARRTVTTAASA